MNIDLQAFDHGIYALDADFVRPRMAAVHLIVEQGRVAFVDTGTFESVPLMLAALEHLGLTVEAVDYVILTHVHLDHAGGAGLLMQKLPNAKLVAHPRGAPHMQDTSKLWAGVVAVYGEETARKDYDELIPIPGERIIVADDGNEVSLAGRSLKFFDCPGHAKHHLFVYDESAAAIFSGDTFGLSYRELDQGEQKFIFPTTTPTQFDPPALRASIDHMLSLKPRAIYLTHYAEITDIASMGADLKRLVSEHEKLALAWEDCEDQQQRNAALEQGVQDIAVQEAEANSGDPTDWLQALGNDIALNAQGLAAWLDFRAKMKQRA
tara:strand:+ start:5194 stop:6159 length:966 start_codon:yes stop_codon:yes gene_type:complete